MRYEKYKVSYEKLVNKSQADGGGSYDRDIQTASDKVKEAEKELADVQNLYSAGAETRANLEKAQKKLEDAGKDLDIKKDERSKGLKADELEIRNAQYDIQLQELNIQNIKSELSTGGQILSPFDGIVTGLNFAKGTMANTASPVVSIADVSKGFEFKTSVDAEAAKYLSMGDAVEIDLKTEKGRTVDGKILELTDSQEHKGEKKDLVVDIVYEGLTGGEAGEINVRKKTGSYSVLIPNSALGEDNKGKFVYVVKEKKGPLGNETYLQKAYITVDDSDNYKTAVSSGIDFRDRIAVNSSKPLSDGSKVIISD